MIQKYPGLFMKKLFLLFTILYTSFAFAGASCKSYNERAFNVVIKNNTGETCTLIAHTLNNGFYSDENKLPMTIPDKKQSQPLQLYIPSYVLIWLLAANIELSYQCGNDKFVTIESQKERSPGDSLLGINSVITITGSILSLSNMDAKYSYIRGSCEKNQSSTIYWTFY
ncbi:MAG: hypothetical protein CK424_07120 [Legionella sp.]|nr:MAG: hypothetical protein CK424_07120 [Legionella sp.]